MSAEEKFRLMKNRLMDKLVSDKYPKIMEGSKKRLLAKTVVVFQLWYKL